MLKPGTIIESGILAASSTDILANTRLANIPGPGSLLIEMQADEGDATNEYQMSLTLPDGQQPCTDVHVPAQRNGKAGTLDGDSLQIPVVIALNSAGGNVILAATEAGTAVLTWRVTYVPAG